MTIKERAHNFATDYAPFSDHTNLEIGYVKGAEEQKQIDIDKIVKWLDDNAFEYVKTETVGIMENYKRFDSEKMITDLKKVIEE